METCFSQSIIFVVILQIYLGLVSLRIEREEKQSQISCQIDKMQELRKNYASGTRASYQHFYRVLINWQMA